MKRLIMGASLLLILFDFWSPFHGTASNFSPWMEGEGRVVEPFENKQSVNRGSKATDEVLQFVAGGHVLGFRKGDMVIASADHALRIEFVNARPVFPAREGISLETANNRQTVTPLGRVSYTDLWDGVTLVYEGHGTGVVKSTYTVQPAQTNASNPVDRIRLRYNVPVAVDEAGNLVFSFETGQLKESRPVAWQEIDGEQTSVEVSFHSLSEREVGFRVGSHDPQSTLVIDPVLSWNTFMGSASGADSAWKLAVDGDGNVYVAGWSTATWGSPVNPFAGGNDAFAVKLNSSGVRQWHTFMGSSGLDFAYGVAVDGSGNVYVAGWGSSWGTPINPSAGGKDAFAAKLSSNGVLLWHTFMGSSSTDGGHTIAVDGGGNVYVAGESQATWGEPVNAHSGGKDAFVAKLNNSGVRLWHTFLGSSEWDFGRDITVDGSGGVYVSGDSKGTWGEPVNAYSGEQDSFVAKLDSNGVRQWHTFMGGDRMDYGMGIAVDGSGNVYLAGYSSGPWGTPVNPFAGVGVYEAFAVKLNSSGVRQWHTFMGSPSTDEGGGIAVDESGNVYVAGYSIQTWGSPENAHSGGFDAFAAILNSNGVRQWHTFLGSSETDFGIGIAVDQNAYVYLAGDSHETWGTPVSPHSGDSDDGFAAKIDVFHVAGGVFRDGFESGDTAAWSGCTGGGLEVLGSAAHSGNFGLQVTPGITCSPNDLMVTSPPTISGDFEACNSVTASGVEVVSPGATFRAGTIIALGDLFSVASGADFTAAIDPSLPSPFAWTQDDSPIAESTYTAISHLRLDALSLGIGDELDYFVGYSSNGDPHFRVVLRKDPTLLENRLAILAREDGGTFREHSSELLLPEGYNRIEIVWQAGEGDGALLVSINSAPLSGLTGLNNSSSQIDFVRLGAVDGTLASTTGAMEMDEFVSFR